MKTCIAQSPFPNTKLCSFEADESACSSFFLRPRVTAVTPIYLVYYTLCAYQFPSPISDSSSSSTPHFGACPRRTPSPSPRPSPAPMPVTTVTAAHNYFHRCCKAAAKDQVHASSPSTYIQAVHRTLNIDRHPSQPVIGERRCPKNYSTTLTETNDRNPAPTPFLCHHQVQLETQKYFRRDNRMSKFERNTTASERATDSCFCLPSPQVGAAASSAILCSPTSSPSVRTLLQPRHSNHSSTSERLLSIATDSGPIQ